VRGTCDVSPEEEKEGYGGKDSQKRGVLSLKRKSERVMNDENSESMEPVGEVGVSTCVSRREPGGFCLSKVLLPHSLADSN